MKNQKLLVMLSLFVILMTVFSNVCAQDTSLPAFKVSTVVTDEKIVLATKNFPADTAYTVSMANPENPDLFTAVAKFNSKTGGSLNVTVKIPAKFQGLYSVVLMLKDDKGGKILGNFVNDPNLAPAPEEPVIEEPVAEEPVAEEPATEEPVAEEPVTEEPAAEEGTDETISLVNQETPAEEPAAEEPAAEEETEELITLKNQDTPAEEPAAEEPAAEEPAAEEPVIEEPAAQEPAAEEVQPTEIPVLVCNFAVIPTVKINAVQRNESVTFTTTNFPANSTFSVSMGEYIQTWVPDMKPVAPMPPMPRPMPGPHHSEADKSDKADASKSKHDHHFPMPAPAPRGHYTSTFKGTEVGTFETGSGESQTLTFQIPEEVKNYGTIALWIQDQGPCGFYSYNYFFNNTVN